MGLNRMPWELKYSKKAVNFIIAIREQEVYKLDYEKYLCLIAIFLALALQRRLFNTKLNSFNIKHRLRTHFFLFLNDFNLPDTTLDQTLAIFIDNLRSKRIYRNWAYIAFEGFFKPYRKS